MAGIEELKQLSNAILAAMLERRDLILVALGDDYRRQVLPFVVTLQIKMARDQCNVLAAMIAVGSQARGAGDRDQGGLFIAAALEILEREISEPAPGVSHLSAGFFKGGLAPAVLINKREFREGCGHA